MNVMTTDVATIETRGLESRDAPAIAFRRLRQGESATYRKMRLESLLRFPDRFGFTYEEEASIARLPFEIAIEAGAGDRFVMGAFAAIGLVGMVGFMRHDRAKTRHRGQISQVYVDPEAHGQSVGGLLMRATLEEAFEVAGIEQVDLSLVTTNHAAQRLYERLGFETFGVQENYFKLGERSWHQRHMQITRERFRLRHSAGFK